MTVARSAARLTQFSITAHPGFFVRYRSQCYPMPMDDVVIRSPRAGDEDELTHCWLDAESEGARNVAAVAALYDQWAQGRPGRYALIAGGGVRATVDGAAAARDAVLALPSAVASALVVALWPQEGWRHPRLVIEAYRRTNAPAPAPAPAPAELDRPFLSDPLLRGFLLAERLHGTTLSGQGTGIATDSDAQAHPYLLIKDGVVLARYKRVTQARQAVAAALPPLAPVIFTSLRLGSLGPFSLMVQQALLDEVGA